MCNNPCSQAPDTVAFVNGVLGGFMRGEFPAEQEAEKE